MPFCRRPAVGWMRNLSGYLRRRLQSSYGIPNGVSPILDLGNQRLSGHSWNRQVPTLPTRTAGELTFKTECRPLLHWTPRQKACGSVWGTQLWNPNSPAEVLKGSVISWLVGKRPISGMPIYFDKLLSSCRNLKRWNDYLHENPDCWCFVCHHLASQLGRGMIHKDKKSELSIWTWPTLTNLLFAKHGQLMTIKGKRWCLWCIIFLWVCIVTEMILQGPRPLLIWQVGCPRSHEFLVTSWPTRILQVKRIHQKWQSFTLDSGLMVLSQSNWSDGRWAGGDTIVWRDPSCTSYPLVI